MAGNHTTVLVVGAGPTGLTLANVLATLGIQARLVDAGDGLTSQSRALGVQSRTIELWDKLGLAERAVEAGQPLSRIYARMNGRTLNADRPLLDLGGTSADLTPFPFMLIHEQSKTERMLHERLGELWGRPDVVEWRTSLTGLRQAPDGDGPVTATLRRPDGTAEETTADWVVGADGASSTVRHALALSFDGGTYEQEFFLADIHLADASALDRREGVIDFTDDGGLVFLPMRGQGYGEQQVRVLGLAPPELAGRADLELAEVQQVLDRYATLRLRAQATNWTATYRLHHRMADRFRVGRVFLAGDAAHIHSPIGGQGMNTGIQDAYNLGWKLGLVCRGEAREALLDSYEPERIPVARSLLRGTDRAFALIPLRAGRVARWARTVLLPLAPRLISSFRLDGALFRSVSQTGITYRHSPAVAPAARRRRGPQPGDRAPHAILAEGEHAGRTVLTLLRGTTYHLLVLADSEPAGVEAAEAVTELTDRYMPPARVHLLGPGEQAVHRAYGASGPTTVVLVRPDGHLAWRGPATSLASLAAHLDRWHPRRA